MPDDGPERMKLRASQTVTLCLGKDDQLVCYRGEVDKPVDAPSVVGYDREGLRRTLLNTAAKIKQETSKDMIVVIKPSRSHGLDEFEELPEEWLMARFERNSIEAFSNEHALGQSTRGPARAKRDVRHRGHLVSLQILRESPFLFRL